MTLDPAELERLYVFPEGDRPWVRTNFVSSLDGAAAGPDGRSGTLGGEVDEQVFALMRSLADVILVGAGTARAEGYGLFEVDTALRERRGMSPAPVMVLASRSLDIPDALVARGNVVVTTADAPADRLTRLEDRLEVVVGGDASVDWSAVLDAFARRGWTKILCEGGPSLHGDLLEQDLVDELCLTIAPVLLAGDAPRVALGDRAAERRMSLGHVVEADGGLLTRWVRDRTAVR